MNQSLAPGIRLEGDVVSVEVDEVRATREALRVRSRLEGTATLVVAPPQAGPAPSGCREVAVQFRENETELRLHPTFPGPILTP
jgi:hypothetical protein